MGAGGGGRDGGGRGLSIPMCRCSRYRGLFVLYTNCVSVRWSVLHVRCVYVWTIFLRLWTVFSAEPMVW